MLNKGRPTPLPDGVLLIVPTKFMPFALSPLISPLGKLRMGMDLFISPKSDDEDETLADFITRRLGNEALDKIAEPLMSGIYNAEADRQSVMATFPRFRAIEKKHGSLIKGMLASRKARTSAPKSPSNATQTDARSHAQNGKPPSIFVTLKDGTHQLAHELHARLTGDIRSGARVSNIELSDGQYQVDVADSNGQSTIAANAVIVTTPAYISADLLRGIAPDAADVLSQIRYVSTGTVSLGYHNEDTKNTIDGFGLVIPQSEGRPINAITFSSTKFDHRAPAGHKLIRVFFGGSRSPQSMELSDEDLLTVVRAQLDELLGIDADPVFHRIYRWHRANPQYDIGHLDRVAAIEAGLPDGVMVTGSAYRGVGIPDCVHQAQTAVDTLLRKLDSAPAYSEPTHTETLAGETT